MGSRINVAENDFLKITRTHYSDGLIMDEHCHDETQVSLVLKGHLSEKVADKTLVGGAAKTLIKPAGVMHENYFTRDCFVLSATIKDASLVKGGPLDVLKEWHWISGSGSVNFFHSLIKHSAEKSWRNHFTDWMRYLEKCKGENQLEEVPKWLDEVKSYLDQHFHSPVRSDELAKEFGVHRVYLARAFRKYFGSSIKEYLTTLRIHSATDSVLSNSQSLAQIALENGFSDQSHFNRKFKEAFQLTPSDIRSLSAE